jgi:hypothetical protein
MSCGRGKRSEVKAKSKAGRKDNATQIATIDMRAEAIKLFLAGLTVAQIAKQLSREKSTIYGFISKARLELIGSKKAHFDERLAILFDDTFDALAANAQLLQDRDFLETAMPERIDSISRAYGILSDKCFILLSAAGNARGAQPEPRPDAEGAGSGSAG